MTHAAVTTGAYGLVDIVRDFLAIDRALRDLLVRYRRGQLRFEEVARLVAGDESSSIFRLKERCHALFRPGERGAREARHREVLFDLAVGSLFHEAMKFRENFYQREVYAPRVYELRDAAGAEAEALFREFEKIDATVSAALEEGLHETEALLDRTREQLAILLAEYRDGFVARTLIERKELVDAVFREGLDDLLSQVYGSASEGYECAGRSYLSSGYYDEAYRALTLAESLGGSVASLAAARAYALGMGAYLKGDYGESVAQLEQWVSAASPEDGALVERVHTAISKIDGIAHGRSRKQLVVAAAALLERIAPLRPKPEAARASD